MPGRVFKSHRRHISLQVDMSLLESPGLNTINTSLSSINLPLKEYVLSLALLPNLYAASASAPSNSIYLFDKTNLHTTQTLSGHDAPITSLRTIHTLAGFNCSLLASSGRDGYVKIWDDRSGSIGLKSKLQTLHDQPCFNAIDGSKDIN